MNSKINEETKEIISRINNNEPIEVIFSKKYKQQAIKNVRDNIRLKVKENGLFTEELYKKIDDIYIDKSVVADVKTRSLKSETTSEQKGRNTSTEFVKKADKPTKMALKGMTSLADAENTSQTYSSEATTNESSSEQSATANFDD